MTVITIIIKYITYFSCIFIKNKNQNQNIKCIMKIMIRYGLKMGTCRWRWVQMDANGSIGVNAIRWTRKCGGQSHRGHGLSESMTTWPGKFPGNAWMNDWCERVVCECMSDREQMCECIFRCGQVHEWEHSMSVMSIEWLHNMWFDVWDCDCEYIYVCVCVCVCCLLYTSPSPRD